MQNGENFKMLEKIADKLGAAIGASRAAVDAGFCFLTIGKLGKLGKLLRQIYILRLVFLALSSI